MNSSNLLKTVEKVEVLLGKNYFQGRQSVGKTPLEFINLHVTNKNITLFLITSFQIDQTHFSDSFKYSFSGEILLHHDVKKSPFSELLFFLAECGEKFGCKKEMQIIIEDFRKNAEIQDLLESI
jgi:hypothetical protein